LKEWTTPDFRKTPSTTNLEEEEIVDAPGKNGNASMLGKLERRNPWKKKKKKMMMVMISLLNDGMFIVVISILQLFCSLSN
jgi:hypothetical protein